MADALTLCGSLVLPDGVRRGWLRVSDGRIAAVGDGPPPAGTAPLAELGERLLAPGFVDLHVHGGDGGDFMSGDPADGERAARFHARHGTTALLATTVTASHEQLLAALAGIAAARRDAPPDAAAILGVHLEGPFLSPARRGAQSAAHLRAPDVAEAERLLAAEPGVVRMMTLAPELPGCDELIAWLAAHDVVPALGHSDATCEQARAALAGGGCHVTHLFNGMRPFHHREPGLAGAALADDAATCELIADGHHVHPAALRTAWRARGNDGIVLVTDAIAGAGLGDGDYELGDQPIQVRVGHAHLADDSTLAGSTLTLDAAVANMVRLAGASVADAIRMATRTPADVLGLARKGRLEAGCDADLVVLTEGLDVEATMIAGRWSHGAHS